MERRRRVAMFIAAQLLISCFQPFFSERNSASRLRPLVPTYNKDNELGTGAITHMLLSPFFILHFLWIVPFIFFGGVAILVFLLRLIYITCTLTITWLTFEPCRLNCLCGCSRGSNQIIVPRIKLLSLQGENNEMSSTNKTLNGPRKLIYVRLPQQLPIDYKCS